MNIFPLTLAQHQLQAMPSGALWWPSRRLLVVGDLHLGKSERIARLGGAFLPPFETCDTLLRLQGDIDHFDPTTVICLGDSFDDSLAADALDETDLMSLSALQAGREWIWVTGNHDPAPLPLAGSLRSELVIEGLAFRHIAHPGSGPEISAHYHPKASITLRGHRITRPAFLTDGQRLILPAYGTYTGGLPASHTAIRNLMQTGAHAILTGPNPVPVPID